MSHQGIDLKENTLYQDNTSAMKMERNGRDSCSQKSRPIDIRYFWIKDRLQNAPNKLEYCPTEQMLADFFTKPLQGNLFKKFRHVVMGWDPISLLQKEYREKYSDELKRSVLRNKLFRDGACWRAVRYSKFAVSSCHVEGEECSKQVTLNGVYSRDRIQCYLWFRHPVT